MPKGTPKKGLFGGTPGRLSPKVWPLLDSLFYEGFFRILVLTLKALSAVMVDLLGPLRVPLGSLWPLWGPSGTPRPIWDPFEGLLGPGFSEYPGGPIRICCSSCQNQRGLWRTYEKSRAGIRSRPPISEYSGGPVKKWSFWRRISFSESAGL